MRLHSDHPVRTSRQDLLGRKVLAQNLAKTILTRNADQSLVFALNGPWGSGKSSVKNLVLETLCGEKRRPIVVEFNPWEIAGQEALTEEFFKAIATSIPKQTAEAAAVECEKQLRRWGRTLDAVGWIGRRAAGVGKLLAPLMGPYGAAFAVGSEFAERVAGAAKESAEITKEAAEITKPETTASLAQQKADLANALAALGENILVVIDDIDRLTADEVCLLFRLIKANCDFPNFIFLVLYDRPYVCTALDQITNNCGDEFLEKIVQVSIDIGLPDRDVIRRLLRREVSDALPHCARRAPLWDEERWAVLADYHIAENIRHLRDLWRLINAFTVTMSAFSSRTTCEVNPIDLLALEYLRLFEPKLYTHLAQSRWILVGDQNRLASLIQSGVITDQNARTLLQNWSPSSEKEKDISTQYRDAILAPIALDRRNPFVEFLSELFPASHGMRRLLRRPIGIESLRVGHREMFDVYFHRAVPKRSISQKTVEKVIKSASRPQDFLKHLRQSLTQGRHSLLLAHLTPKAGVLSIGGETVLFALMQFAEEITYADPDWWWDWSRSEILRLFSACLCEKREVKDRWECLSRLIQKTKFIRLLFHLGAEEIGPNPRQNLPESERAIPIQCVEDFKSSMSACAQRCMWTAAESGNRDLLWLLYRWRDVSDFERVRAWLRTTLANPRRLPFVLRGCAGQSRFEGKVIHQYAWNPKDMAAFLARDEWLTFAEAATNLTTKSWQRDVMDSFLNLLRNGGEMWMELTEPKVDG